MIKQLEEDKETCRVKTRLYKGKVEKYEIDKVVYENQKQYNDAKNLLKVYEDKKEEIEEKRKKMSRAENKGKVEKYEIDKVVYENQKQYNDAKNLLKVYEDKKEEIEEKRKKMSRSENANMIDPYIDNVEKLQKQFEESKNQLKVIEDEIRFIKKDLEISRARFAEIERKKDDTIPRLSEEN